MTLYYRTIGSGPDLVLLHGFAFNSDIWAKVESALCESYTLHLIDLPGCGRSQSDVFPDDIHQAVSQLVPYFPKSAHYVGWSLGGLLALQIALSYPERVNSVMAVASTPCFIEQANWRGVPKEFFEQFRSGMADNAVKTTRQFVARMLKDPKSLKANLSSLLSLIGNCDPQSLDHMLEVLRVADLRSQLPDIKVPCCFMQDADDPLSPINDTTTLVVPGMGHLPMWMDPDKFVENIKAFIQ